MHNAGRLPRSSRIRSLWRPAAASAASARRSLVQTSASTNDGGAARAARSRVLYALPCRRDLLAAVALLAAAPCSAADERTPLWERLERRILLKPLFSQRTAVQAFPEWLLGDWTARVVFEGYAFPSQTVAKAAVAADTSLPGFLKLSIVFIPDVGSPLEHALRFVRAPGGEVVEDRAFALASTLNAGLGGESAVQEVVYDPEQDANRLTVVLRPGAANNAERVELFTNNREAAERPADGVFFAAETIRQVTMGYSVDFNRPRVAVTDYQIVRRAWAAPAARTNA